MVVLWDGNAWLDSICGLLQLTALEAQRTKYTWQKQNYAYAYFLSSRCALFVSPGLLVYSACPNVTVGAGVFVEGGWREEGRNFPPPVPLLRSRMCWPLLVLTVQFFARL